MPGKRPDHATRADATLAAFACPHEDCSDFNRFGAGNLSVCEWMGKDRQIRRLYCRMCGHRFSERQGTLLQYAKLPEETLVRIVKCLVHGCSVEATADICEVTPRTGESLLKRAGRRGDELHGRSAPPTKKGGPVKLSLLPSPVASDAARAARGFMRRWWARRGS